MFNRNRKLRKNQSIRDLVQETNISLNDLICPIFLIDGKNKTEEISSMSGIYRKSLDLQLIDIQEMVSLGIKSIILFPSINKQKKTKDAREALNPSGLIPKSIKSIKRKFPNIVVISDIALDPYNSDGHDGIYKDGIILNDETVKILTKQALLHAKSGVDFVSPSDMMDGRIFEIRNSLDKNGFEYTGIISYSAKFASSLYGPFRDALNSELKQGDKKTYQINPANSREALKEIIDDESEGADMVMIKPASLYLDIIHQAKNLTLLPVVAYQVSGEYSMIKTAGDEKFINLDDAILESLLSIKRAGADLIISYFTYYLAKNKLVSNS